MKNTFIRVINCMDDLQYDIFLEKFFWRNWYHLIQDMPKYDATYNHDNCYIKMVTNNYLL